MRIRRGLPLSQNIGDSGQDIYHGHVNFSQRLDCAVGPALHGSASHSTGVALARYSGKVVPINSSEWDPS